MPTFNSIAAALKYIKEAIDDTLGNEVAEAVKEEEIVAVHNTVYAAYGNNSTKEPNVYERRKTEGGLADPNNMVPTVVDGALEVWNITTANSEYGNDGYLVADIVYNGGPYDYKKGMNTFGNFRMPRDFIGGTYANLNESKSHIQALKAGLSKRGITVK